MSIDQADRFLAACARAALFGQPAPPWPAGLRLPEHLETVRLRARFHGIAVLLGHAGAIMSAWPAPLADALREEMRLAALWEALHRDMICRLIEALADDGIASMVMKGTALAYLHYEEPAIRRRGDTDLLIRPEDLARVRDLLRQAGCYRREDPHGLYFQETWLIDCG